jgi:predicted PurR-regulated permease PerM
MSARDRNWDWQSALFPPLTILAWLAVIVIGGWLLGHLVKTILTLVLAGIVAFALTPLVHLLARYMPRALAITVAYVVGFSVIFGVLAFVIVTASAQVSNLVQNLPHYSQQAHTLQPQIVKLLKPFGVTNANYVRTEHQLTTYLETVGTRVASQSVGIATTIVGTVVDVVLVLILSVYLTANGPKLSGWLRRQTPASQRRHTTLLIAIVNQVVGGYIRGQLTLALLIGALVGGGMLVLHVPYAVLLGVLAFFMEFIPVIGVLISGAVCIIIALFQGWVVAVIVLAYFAVVHVIEGDVVGPRIVGHAVGIHPATSLVALVAGTELFGIWGALFGAPIAGLIQTIATAAYHELSGADPKAVLDAVVQHQKARADGAGAAGEASATASDRPETTGTTSQRS